MMYNRYIPQPDGSYRRNRVPDKCRPVPPRPSSPPDCPPQEPRPEPPTPPCVPKGQDSCHHPKPESCHKNNHDKAPIGGSVSGFLRQLLPKDFDTGDLLIILLLLIMAGDCAEDQNTALLTLALYLFM